MELLKPDLCIIGAGAGGLDAASAAALTGKSVVLVEKDKVGGARLHGGAVPAQALVTAARRMHEITEALAFGIDAPAPTLDVGKLVARIAGVVAALTPDATRERITGLGVRVIEGAAQFKGRRRLTVGDSIEIKAHRFVIATGSRPALPDIPGLAETPYLTGESVLTLTRIPEHLVVIGGTPVALALAQAFRRLGAAVTVLADAAPLADEDPECVRMVLDALARDGVTLRAGAAITRVAKAQGNGGNGGNGKVQVVLGSPDGEETLAASHLLIAAGRTPAIDGLALDKARVKTGPHGILVNDLLRTRNRRIFAIGDVTGAPPSVHLARHHASLVVRNALFGQSARVNLDQIPRVAFTDPELAHVGLTDAEAERRRLKYRVLRWPFAENDRAQIEGATRGHLKVVIDRAGRVLGATIVGAGAAELITTWTLALAQGIDIRTLSGIVLPYPTLADIGKRAAMTYFTLGSTQNRVRRIIRLLRRSR